jgi:exodeoxyribonuclease V alpha subunit
VNTPCTIKKLQDILSCPEVFSSLDNHFAMFIGRLARKYKPETALAAALVSRKVNEGNICLDLKELAGNPLHLPLQKTDIDTFVCPDFSDWTEQLLQSGTVSYGEGNSPLVLAGNGRLYLRRYWEYENTIIRFILQQTNSVPEDLSYSKLGRDLKKLFDRPASGETDWQQVAAIAAVSRSFCVISGGPGTGKTFTVAKILALLLGQHNNTRQLRILLGAPTGKAASRLQQTFDDTGLMQSGSEPLQATTVHRMLGYVPNSPYFRHNAQNPLAADIIVIDEASMIDLPLMAKLLQAVPAAARLILLGDRHQLASVQPGSVLGDLCRSEIMPNFSGEFYQLVSKLTGKTISPRPYAGKAASTMLQDSFVELRKSYRFAPDSGIARFSKAVKKGDSGGALDILLGARDDSIAWSESDPAKLGIKLQGWPGVAQFATMQHSPEPDLCFAHLEQFRILCALRSGPFGIKRVNSLLEQQIALQVQGNVSNHTPVQFAGITKSLPYHPVMVTRNDYNLQLFNGDVGIILPNPENQQSSRVFFKEGGGKLRDIALPLLPEHETVFAMTVHKSQGSEFNRVLLILPDKDSPLLTRELLYTAITRARDKVEIWGKKEILVSALKRQIKRTSGLSEAIWNEDI